MGQKQFVRVDRGFYELRLPSLDVGVPGPQTLLWYLVLSLAGVTAPSQRRGWIWASQSDWNQLVHYI